MLIIFTGFKKEDISLAENAFIQQDTTLRITLPAEGKLVSGRPIGKNWVNLLNAANELNWITNIGS